MSETPKTGNRVVIAGGGPAGMMAGLLLARAGVAVTVLEKHRDFFRDFRGDTVHPSTLELFARLGWLEELLTIPHSRVEQIGLRMAGREWQVADFRHLPVTAPFVAMMPQWDLLDFIAKKASQFPTFELCMEAEASDLLYDPDERVSGVKLADGSELSARLVIDASGRKSVLREKAGFNIRKLGAPMDVFWFRLDKPQGFSGETFGVVKAGHFLVMIDRRDYFQSAFLVPKGGADKVRAKGIEAFRGTVRDMLGSDGAMADSITDWDDVKLLDVGLDRLDQWHRPGLLTIGDAAHTMSPIGGVGINVAVQDAVAVGNVLGAALAAGADADALIGRVQEVRERSVKRMQGLQQQAQKRVIEPLLQRAEPIEKPFWPVRVLNAVPLLRRLPGRIIGLGFDRLDIKSPDAFSGAGASQ